MHPSFQETVIVSFGAPERFELAGWPVAEAGVEALVVVDGIDEVLQIGFGLGQGAVVVQVDLLPFEGGEEALGQRIFVSVADGGHEERQRRFRLGGALPH